MLDACPSIIGYLPKYYWILAQILLDTCPSIIGYFVTCPMMKTNGYRFLCQVLGKERNVCPINPYRSGVGEWENASKGQKKLQVYYFPPFQHYFTPQISENTHNFVKNLTELWTLFCNILLIKVKLGLS